MPLCVFAAGGGAVGGRGDVWMCACVWVRGCVNVRARASPAGRLAAMTAADSRAHSGQIGV